MYASSPVIIVLHRSRELLTRKLQLARQPAGNDEDPTRPAGRTTAAGTLTSGLHSPGRHARMGRGDGTREQPRIGILCSTSSVKKCSNYSPVV